VYFSAHWCPPCRQFTPQLARFYQQAKQAGRKFEVGGCDSSCNVDYTSANKATCAGIGTHLHLWFNASFRGGF